MKISRMPGFRLVGVPKTIDNDVAGTDLSFGFDTAVSIVHRGYRPAPYHRRITSPHHGGRSDGTRSRVDCILAGIAGGADEILIPEIRFTHG